MGVITDTSRHNLRVTNGIRRDLWLAAAGMVVTVGLAVSFAWRMLRLARRQLQRMSS